MNVYEHCPEIAGGRFVLRLVTEEDCRDLLKVYSDEASVPLFNSDNCNGDDAAGDPDVALVLSSRLVCPLEYR